MDLMDWILIGSILVLEVVLPLIRGGTVYFVKSWGLLSLRRRSHLETHAYFSQPPYLRVSNTLMLGMTSLDWTSELQHSLIKSIIGEMPKQSCRLCRCTMKGGCALGWTWKEYPPVFLSQIRHYTDFNVTGRFWEYRLDPGMKIIYYSLFIN